MLEFFRRRTYSQAILRQTMRLIEQAQRLGTNTESFVEDPYLVGFFFSMSISILTRLWHRPLSHKETEKIISYVLSKTLNTTTKSISMNLNSFMRENNQEFLLGKERGMQTTNSILGGTEDSVNIGSIRLGEYYYEYIEAKYAKK